jgi:hypothetical protein
MVIRLPGAFAWVFLPRFGCDNSSRDLKVEERPAEESHAEQQRLSKPVKFPENRKEFWDKCRKLGLEKHFKLHE